MKKYIFEQNKQSLYYLQNISDAFNLKDLKLMRRKVQEAKKWLESPYQTRLEKDVEFFVTHQLLQKNHISTLIELVDTIQEKDFKKVIQLIKSLNVKQFVKHPDVRNKDKEEVTNDK